jgi:hypothetical protein
VWAALAVSGATLVLCLVLGFLPVRWRRWFRSRLPRRLRGPAGPDAPERPGSPFDLPRLAFPFTPPPKEDRQRGWLRFPRALVIGAVTGAVALLVVTPLAALGVGALVALGLVVPWARAAAAVGGIAFIVAGCLNVVQGQRVHDYLPGSNWDGSFVHAGNLIWLGVVLLVADAVISGLGWRVPKPIGRRGARAVPYPVLAAAGTGRVVSGVPGAFLGGDADEEFDADPGVTPTDPSDSDALTDTPEPETPEPETPEPETPEPETPEPETPEPETVDAVESEAGSPDEAAATDAPDQSDGPDEPAEPLAQDETDASSASDDLNASEGGATPDQTAELPIVETAEGPSDADDTGGADDSAE